MNPYSTQAALIIFIKNPIPGKVKTRIGHVLGDDKALEIYGELLLKTKIVSGTFAGPKFLFYSDFIEEVDTWDSGIFSKNVQTGEDLGQRMFNAFDKVLAHHPKAIIIGSDCPYLNIKDLEEAEHKLDIADLVLGPAGDGGFYLMGLKKPVKNIFEDRHWSHPSVFNETLQIAHQLKLKTAILRTLWDIDTPTDWEFYRMLEDVNPKR